MPKLLDPSVENISVFFKSRFSVPIFQRPYNWEQEQIKQFLIDIKDNYEKNEFLFIGTIYLNNAEDINTSLTKYNVIDGQQRIITLCLMLLSYYCIAFKYGIQDEKEINEIKFLLWKSISNRELNINQRLLETMGIEGKLLKDLFDVAFNNPMKFKEKIDGYTTSNPIEKRLINNLSYIYANIESQIVKGTELYDFNYFLNICNYILEQVKFVVIKVESDFKKMFEIFESINSKGKQLDTIDLIKSYIFLNINETEYDSYLQKWGELIEKTNDKLEEYLNVYIRAFFKYYNNSLSVANFKSLCSDSGELKKIYNSDNLSFRLTSLLDDMCNRVGYYNYLQKYNSSILGNNPSHKFKFYFTCLKYMDYKHPRALLFRMLCDFKESNGTKVSKKDVINITKNSFVYMFCFQTLFNRDSKDSISLFSTIMEDVYQNGIDVQVINKNFNMYLDNSGISGDKIKNILLEHIGYDNKEKQESRILLATYEFYDNINKRIDYDKGVWILEHTKEIEVDHILPQYPLKEDENYFYYMEKENNVEKLYLKKGHDFNNPDVVDGMEYKLFKNKVLNRLGNLRLSWKSDNIDKSNRLVSLPKYKKFKNYSKVNSRARIIAKRIYSSELFKID